MREAGAAELVADAGVDRLVLAEHEAAGERRVGRIEAGGQPGLGAAPGPVEVPGEPAAGAGQQLDPVGLELERPAFAPGESLEPVLRRLGPARDLDAASEPEAGYRSPHRDADPARRRPDHEPRLPAEDPGRRHDETGDTGRRAGGQPCLAGLESS